MKVRSINALAAAAGVATCFAGGYLLSHDLSLQRSSGPQAAVGIAEQQTLSAVRGALLRRYVRPLDARTLVGGSLPDLLGTLRDPYTVYYTPTQYAAVRADLASAYVGIGVRVAPDARGLRGVDAVHGSPAALHGMASGDAILAIDGVPTRGLAFDDALARLDGVAGTQVGLRVRHTGRRDPVEVRLVRIRLHPDAVTSRTVGHGPSK